MKRGSWIGIIIVSCIAVPAFAGTTTIDFANNTGLLTYKLSGAGTLSAVGGRGSFSNSNMTVLAQNGSPIYSGGTTSATMTLQPSVDAAYGVGIVMTSGGDQLTAMVDGYGTVQMMDWIGNYVIGQFSYPNAGNNYLTLSYSASTERATLSLNGSASGFLEMALDGATSVEVGVMSFGPGGLARFVVTGSGIPNYPPPVVDTDGDGVYDDVEGTAGTDLHDPGSLPVYNTTGATIHALNGATVVIPAGSLASSQINVTVSTPPSIPVATVPGGKALSQVGLELKPDGTHFSAPVTVTLPYQSSQLPGLIESTLGVFYYTGHSYASTGIVLVNLNMPGHTATFTTNHFTTFALAGSLVDSDGDGIDDWWETKWFGVLTTATATSNFDHDDLMDIEEFHAWDIGANPKVAGESLPVGGALVLALLGSGLALTAIRRLRR